MWNRNRVLSPNKQFVLSSHRHGSLLLVAGGQEGAELWQTTCCVEVDLRYVELQQVIVPLSSAESAAPSLLCRLLQPCTLCLCLINIALLPQPRVAVISA